MVFNLHQTTVPWFNCSKTQPAWATTIPETESMCSILFNRDVLRITSSKTGTDPPTSPVFPPCGQTAIFRSLQYFKILETCSVFWGLRQILDLPRTMRIQSMLWPSKFSSPMIPLQRDENKRFDALLTS